MSPREGMAIYRPQGTNIEILTEKQQLVFNGAVFSFDLLHALSDCVDTPLVMGRGHDGTLFAQPYSSANRRSDMTTQIHPDHLQRLSEMTVPELAEIWSILNRHEWPHDGLPIDVMASIDYEGYRHTIMQMISNEIGMKECLRAWNKDRMTPQEFESWWNIRPRFKE